MLCSQSMKAILVGCLAAAMFACGSGGTPSPDNDNVTPPTDVDTGDNKVDVVNPDGVGPDIDKEGVIPGDVQGQDLPDGYLPDTETDVVQPDNVNPDGAADTVLDLGDVEQPKICKNNLDCDGGYCMELPPGSGTYMCAPLCDNGCPFSGWQCRDMYIDGPDPVNVCVPPFDVLCRACTKDLDCLFTGSICIKGNKPTGFCGRNCNPAKTDCPDGYQCQIINDAQGQALAYQCHPKPGACCSANKWQNCNDENICTDDSCVPGTGCVFDPVADGTPCGDEQECFVYSCASGTCTGWPITEDLTYNAEDDDCDGLTDEDVYKGVHVDNFTYGSGAQAMSGGNFKMIGVMNAPPYHGVSAGGKYRVSPGLPFVQ